MENYYKTLNKNRKISTVSKRSAYRKTQQINE